MISPIWRVNIATMMFFTLVQIVVPLIPLYTYTFSTDPVLIGLAVSSISITAILLRPVSGVVSDRWSRSRMMILGLVLASIAYLILCFSNDILHIVIARLVEGAGVASFVPSSIASAVDQAPKGKLGETLGWRSMMIALGFAIGLSLGGPLADFFGFQTTFGMTSVTLVFLIPLVIFRGIVREPLPGDTSFQGLKERGFILAFVALIVYSLAWMGVYVFLETYLESLQYSTLAITLFLVIQAVFSVAIRVLAGRAADKRPMTMTYLGLLTMSIALFLICLNQLPPYVYIAAPVFGIGAGTYVPGSQTLALMKAPKASRGFLSSIYTMGYDIGTLIGPIMFGFTIQLTGSYQSVFVLAPALMFMAAMIVLLPARLSYSQP